MSGDNSDEDKQFEPSQKKLDDARKKGEIPRSVDLTTAAAYGGILAAAFAFGPNAMVNLGDAMMILIDQADQLARVTFEGSRTPIIGGILQQVVWSVAPLFGVPALFAVLAVIGQRAFVVAPARVKPKLSNISLLQGFKKKFGRNGFFEFAKSFSKLLIFSAVLFLFLWQQMDRMIGAMFMSPGMIVVSLLRLVLTLLLIVLAIALAIGAIDFLWQRAEHLRKHRMSRKEMMDELKQSEGDPMMKQQRRQKGMDLATNQMLADVPDANVVVVNPTHYAVALKWDRMSATAPVCVAKGTDEIAARIREVAAENGVPLHSDPPTARALHATVDIGDEIPPDHYQAVAAAIRFAESIRAKATARR
ncbi:flagellar biosynthesis protein FlhB [Yoonia sp. R2331]|uniref:EscU/YscU/HrcU family type III secretion system export apparatus switch protein n=1 Tax=Yoonia sp. R2331 TaxID=3237238 RepID=UPI0034E4C58A